MRIILSRKSFDSIYGGKPNLIFQDGTLLPLPIPAHKYVSKKNFNGLDYVPTEYRDIKIPNNIQMLLQEMGIINIDNYAQLMVRIFEKYRGKKIQKLVEGLNLSLCDKSRKPYYCHLDPDLIHENLMRSEGWRGLFGPHPKYQKHLKDDLKKKDLFLFFGTFRHVIIENDNLRYAEKRDGDDLLYKGKHIMYGYLQVSRVIMDSNNIDPWMYNPYYHPHLDSALWNKENKALYVASNKVVLNNRKTDLPGWGMFDFNDDLILTENYATKSVWKKDLIPENSIIKHMGKIIDQKNWNSRGCFSWNTFGQEFIIENCPNFENHIIDNIFKYK